VGLFAVRGFAAILFVVVVVAVVCQMMVVFMVRVLLGGMVVLLIVIVHGEGPHAAPLAPVIVAPRDRGHEQMGQRVQEDVPEEAARRERQKRLTKTDWPRRRFCNKGA
jgi:hypothetical protein